MTESTSSLKCIAEGFRPRFESKDALGCSAASTLVELNASPAPVPVTVTVIRMDA